MISNSSKKLISDLLAESREISLLMNNSYMDTIGEEDGFNCQEEELPSLILDYIKKQEDSSFSKELLVFHKKINDKIKLKSKKIKNNDKLLSVLNNSVIKKAIEIEQQLSQEKNKKVFSYITINKNKFNDDELLSFLSFIKDYDIKVFEFNKRFCFPDTEKLEDILLSGVCSNRKYDISKFVKYKQKVVINFKSFNLELLDLINYILLKK